jgi:hypothetical protein
MRHKAVLSHDSRRKRLEPVKTKGAFRTGLRWRHDEYLFPRHAVKPCGATQSCSACRRGLAFLRCAPALRGPCCACVPAQAFRGLGVRRDDPCASHSLLRLGTGPSLPWLGRSPGRVSTGHSPYPGSPTGLLSFSGSPCCAWKTGAEHPGSARSPGQSLRCALPASLGHRPKPSVAWAFAGTTVHRTVVFVRLTHRTVVFVRLTHRTVVFVRLTQRTLA